MKYKIAVFPGDGVGPELVKEGIKIIEKAAELDKFEIELVEYLYGGEHYLESNSFLDGKALKDIKNNCNAIYCGTFDNFVKEANGIATTIRSYFDQFASLRPVKLLPNVESTLTGKTHEEIDFVIIRENTEDFYVGASGKSKSGNRQQFDINNSAFKAKFGLSIEAKSEIAYQIGVLSKKGCERIMRFAFEYAKTKNKKKLAFIDKANILGYYNFWREIAERISKEYSSIEYEFNLIDTAVMQFIRQPEKYEVVVAPNMFGDILSDLGAMIQGGLSFAARGNINPNGISMFEPVHGSASTLKGQGIVNPIATIWAGALMLDAIGQQKSSELIVKAIESVLKEGRTRTQDLGGNNSTSEMGDAILDKLIEVHD